MKTSEERSVFVVCPRVVVIVAARPCKRAPRRGQQKPDVATSPCKRPYAKPMVAGGSNSPTSPKENTQASTGSVVVATLQHALPAALPLVTSKAPPLEFVLMAGSG